jgi:BirA family transcriptional regulator, biotin operon repressor / biotin---[acetyl-CoA-carboxylase] ligase
MENIGDLFIELPSVNSTNIYAMQQVHARLAKHGTAYFAHEQTQGKGQRGKTWSSRAGENITLSVVFEPLSLNLNAAFFFNTAITLACYDFCKLYLGDETRIKWPNDLYWRDRKAGGILIENLVRGSTWEFAVAGIGLNINQIIFPPDLINPVSFRQITGREFKVIDLAKDLCEHIQEQWDALNLNSEYLLKAYNAALYKKGESVKLKKGNRIFEARIDSVNANGQLEVFTTISESFSHGEVEWLI